MSSMFKKKGALAFKPKIPSIRPRPAASSINTAADTTATTTLSTTKTAVVDTTSHEPVAKSIEAESQDVTVIEAPVGETRHRLRKSNQTSPREEGAADHHNKRQDEKAPATLPMVGETLAQPAPISPIETEPPSSSSKRPTISKTSTRHDSSDAVVPRPSSSHHKDSSDVEERPEPSYRHQNPTPPPSISESLIAPELRDKPAVHETHELAPLLGPMSTAQVGQEIPSADGESRPTKPTAKPTPPRTRARRKAAESVEDDVKPGAGGGEDDTAAARPKKRQRKAPAQDAADEPSPAPTSSARQSAPRQPKVRKSSASTSRASSAKPKRARSLTPEDAETQTVDLQKLKMTDLTKDLHIGRKFSRHDELRDRERQARLKSKLRGSVSRSASETPDEPSSSSAAASQQQPLLKPGSATPSTTSAPVAPTPPGSGVGTGPQFHIVDGEIRVDQKSLALDRHARADAARGALETVEENDFTRLITSNSFMATSKLRGPNIWTDEETELFYRGLRMFGTEFEMISRMFPNKQRRHVKLKYNREERHCPERITATICGVKTDKIDIDEYKLFTGMEFETVESIEAEHRRIREGFEAEQQRAADEQAEVMRRKREELFADDKVDPDAEAGLKKKGKKRGGKQAVAYGLNGEPIMTG